MAKVWSEEFQIEFKSKFELDVALLLKDSGYEWEYEKSVFESPTRVNGHACPNCGTPMFRKEKYTPDFVAWHPKLGEVVIEVKGGNFTRSSVPRIRRFFKHHGDLVDYIIVFRSNCKISHLKDKPTVKKWGEKYGIGVLCGLDELKRWLS